jgi:serine/threonine protein kinase
VSHPLLRVNTFCLFLLRVVICPLCFMVCVPLAHPFCAPTADKISLAARNVLVLNTHERPLKLRIADFGLSRLIPDGESSVTAVGYQVPYRYLDPAVLHEHAFDKETDVWAGGVLFWEMAARRTPYEEIPIALDVLYACSKGLRLQRPTPRFPVRMPDAVLDEFYDVMKSCWVTENRPTFRKLASKFGEMIKRGAGDLTGEDASKNKVEHKGAPVATSFTPYQQMVTNHHRVEDGYGDLEIRSSADPSTPQVWVPSGTASPVPGHQLVLPPGTTMLYDAQGKPYFQNNVDKTTSYEIPKGT